MRGRTVWRFAANPFVVMTDITIALAFVMFGYYLANENSFARYRAQVERIEEKRDARLVDVANQVAERVRDRLGPDYVVDTYQEVRQGRVRPVPGKAPQGRTISVIALVGRPGEPPYLQIDRNETLMRLRLYGLEFVPGTSRFARPEEAESVLGIVASQVRPALPGTAYLFVHGIAAESDGKDEDRRVKVSRERADLVRKLLARAGLLLGANPGSAGQGPYPSPAVAADEGFAFGGEPTYVVSPNGDYAMLPSYVITYGTGTGLYADPWRLVVATPGDRRGVRVAPKGRVDLVFFFRTPSSKGIGR
ncbi:MAG: hypothetical protein ACK41F_04355 [Fimbriimonadaceae bacterium]